MDESSQRWVEIEMPLLPQRLNHARSLVVTYVAVHEITQRLEARQDLNDQLFPRRIVFDVDWAKGSQVPRCHVTPPNEGGPGLHLSIRKLTSPPSIQDVQQPVPLHTQPLRSGGPNVLVIALQNSVEVPQVAGNRAAKKLSEEAIFVGHSGSILSGAPWIHLVSMSPSGPNVSLYSRATLPD